MKNWLIKDTQREKYCIITCDTIKEALSKAASVLTTTRYLKLLKSDQKSIDACKKVFERQDCTMSGALLYRKELG